MYCSMVSAIASASSSSEYSWSESKLKSGDLNSSRLSVLKCLEVGSIRRIQVLDTAYWGFLGAQIRRIFLDGYGVLVFRIVIFKISSFKLQNARLLLTFTNYSIITARGELITELEKLCALRAVKAVAFLREVKDWNLENVADIMRIVNEAKGRV
ncbi:hypothetical protein Tco_0423943 [Tanacetum coccineum]